MPTSFSTDLPLRGRILIVDDMMENVLVLNNILKEQHEVLFALKGDKAIELAQTRAPDLILLDAVMPEMDGYVLTKHIKADSRFDGIPVVMHSSLSSEANRAMGQAVGVDAYVAKFDAEVLADTLRPLLER